MTKRTYDAATAKALFELAFSDWEWPPYVIRDDGIYPSDEFREGSPHGAVLDWTPADEMDWQGSPNPDGAPVLPIPFTANQLAACMLDGAGFSIQERVDRRIGYALEPGALDWLTERQ